MKFRKITADTRVDYSTLGPDWIGLIYFRIYAGEDWITFRGIKVGYFNFILKLPAVVENLIAEGEREYW